MFVTDAGVGTPWIKSCMLLILVILVLQGLDHVIMVAAAEKMVYLRQYAVRLKKSGTQVLLQS